MGDLLIFVVGYTALRYHLNPARLQVTHTVLWHRKIRITLNERECLENCYTQTQDTQITLGHGYREMAK